MAKWIDKLFGLDTWEESEESKKEQDAILDEFDRKFDRLRSNIQNGNVEDDSPNVKDDDNEEEDADSFNNDFDEDIEIEDESDDSNEDDNSDDDILSASELKEKLERIQIQLDKLKQQYDAARSDSKRIEIASKMKELGDQINIYR